MTADDREPRELAAVDAALAGEPVPDDLTEIGALALALREQRAEPSAAFARDLDQRAAAGFPRRRPRARVLARLRATPLLVPGGAVAATCAAIVAVVVVTGPSQPGGSDGAGSGGGASSSQAMEEPATAGRPDGGGAAGAPGSEAADAGGRSAATSPSTATTVAPVPPAGGSPRSDGRRGRYVERSAAITLAARPRDIDRAAAGIIAVADRLGGFVASSSVSSGTSGGGGEFVLRIPSARLSEALAQLSRVAHVRERRQDAADVTAERTSAADRLAEARAERASLLRRLAAAQTDAESASLRARLREVNRRIARNRAALSRVDNRARYANVAVSLVADRSAGGAAAGEDDGVWSPGDAAADAVRVLEVVAGVALIALALLAPVALLAAAVVALRRLAARRERRRVLDAV